MSDRPHVIEVRDSHFVGIAEIVVGGDMITIRKDELEWRWTPDTVALFREALDEALLLVGYQGSEIPPRDCRSGPTPGGEQDKEIRKTIERETAVIRTLCSELLMQTWQGTLDLKEIALKAHGLIEAARNIKEEVA